MSSNNYVLVTDGSCDLPTDYLEKENIPAIYLHFTMDGKDYAGDEMPIEEFYTKMREGVMPITAQVNQQAFRDWFVSFLEQGLDILYIAFSSGLSGTCAGAQAVARELREEYPERKLYVIDSLCASLGQGLLVHKANALYKDGVGIEELREYVENLKLKIAHSFTVEDLMHLHRGGRVSKASAVAGSLLGIKPVLHVDDLGHLIPLSKVRGRKASLDRVFTQMAEWVGDTPNDIAMISHGDDLESAEYVAKLLKKEFGIKEVLINHVGTVIGTHSGPGTIALFMVAKERYQDDK